MHMGRGFTLIELIVTISIVGILVALVAPSFNQIIQKKNLEKSTRLLVLTLNQARSTAILERHAVTVKLNSSAPDSNEIFNWQPIGKAKLKTGSDIHFEMTGLLSEGDRVFEICAFDSADASSKIIMISRIGVIESIQEGTC